MQILTTIQSAAPRTVNTRDGRSFELYEITDSNGQAWVMRQDSWNQARQLIGQQVELVGRVEQKGNFVNYFADVVTPIGARLPIAESGPMQPATQAVVQAQQAAQNAGRVPQDFTYTITEKDRSIHRQSAAKVAAAISSSPQEFWANVQDLARYFDTGVTPYRQNAQPSQSEMAGVGATDGYQYSDQDIPF